MKKLHNNYILALLALCLSIAPVFKAGAISADDPFIQQNWSTIESYCKAIIRQADDPNSPLGNMLIGISIEILDDDIPWDENDDIDFDGRRERVISYSAEECKELFPPEEVPEEIPEDDPIDDEEEIIDDFEEEAIPYIPPERPEPVKEKDPYEDVIENSSDYGMSNSYTAPEKVKKQSSADSSSPIASSANKKSDSSVPEKENPLGVSSSKEAQPTESSSNTGLIVALLLTAALAVTAAVFYIYKKRKA